MTNAQIQHIINEVVQRIIIRKGGNGRLGSLIVVFTGSNNNLDRAISEVRRSIMDGYKIKLILSKNAEKLYGSVIHEKLMYYPHVSLLHIEKWEEELNKAKAVAIPILSLNTLSRVSLLIADSQPSQLIVHALLMNKPVLAAPNSIFFHGGSQVPIKQNPFIKKSILERLKTMMDYGCKMVELKNMKNEINSLFHQRLNANPNKSDKSFKIERKKIRHKGKIVTASQIQQSRLANADLVLSSETIITPLARDIAMTHQVKLLRSSGN